MSISYLPRESTNDLPALLVLPPRPAALPAPLLISVHGYTRQPLEHVDVFAPLAAARGWALLVPVFDERAHRHYQRLLDPKRGTRSDLDLIALVERQAGRHGLALDRWRMFGFSAGAQFAHRFALLHPRRLAALALGAPGWYTWPDRQRPFPLGWAEGDLRLGRPAPEEFLRLPCAVWVGERDVQPDDHLRRDADIEARQGPHRLARARAWVHSLGIERSQLGLPPPTLHVVPGAGHSLSACHRKGGLGEAVMRFLAEPEGAGAARLPGADHSARAAGAVAGAGHTAEFVRLSCLT